MALHPRSRRMDMKGQPVAKTLLELRAKLTERSSATAAF